MTAKKPPQASGTTGASPAKPRAKSRTTVKRTRPKAQAIEIEEPAAPMSEHPHVHAPQQGIHTWRDFAIHIAVVAIGLLLAIGLQQVVEAIHHRQQRAQLEEQMRETFEFNSKLIAADLRTLDGLRAYLVELRLAVDARIQGQSVPRAPSEADPRNYTYTPPPNLGAYEASKANGTVALLSLDRIRLYDRIEYGQILLETDAQRYINNMIELRSFRERFSSAPVPRYRLPNADLAVLSNAELIEYRALIGKVLGAAQAYDGRLRNLDLQSRAILDGAGDERELRAAVANLQGGKSAGEVPKL
jgi:hypothetical protein